MTRKVRVVVADDHPMFREGVVRALVMSGEVDVVAEADDGATSLELIKTHQPDVALLDYRMPGMDGAEVAAAVRRDELDTRVLLLSAHDESTIVYHALAEGVAGFLSKESSRTEIVNAVGQLCEGPRRGVAGVDRRPGRRDPQALGALGADAERARTRGARPDRRRLDHSCDRGTALPGAVDSEDPRAEAL
jgi:two-component system, NarL family, nitrate/nitrite response regulator NarL